MEYIEYQPTEEVKERLIKLRDFMNGPGREFNKLNMRTYYWNENSKKSYCSPSGYECGTSMCLAGHGLAAGISVPVNCVWENGVIDFCAYADWLIRGDGVFSPPLNPVYSTIWEFLFSPKWPNDYDECVARLDMTIQGRVPSDWGYHDRFSRKETSGETNER